MVKMADSKVVSINYFRRWNPSFIRLRDELHGGMYGKVITTRATYTKGILGNGSHLIDLMLWFFGEPLKIRFIKIHNPDAQDPGVDFSLTFKNNIMAYFLNLPEVNYVFIEVDILTEKGRIVIGQRGQSITKYQIITEPYFQKFNILKKIDERITEWRNCLTQAVQEITGCLRNGGMPSCIPEDGLRVLETCHKLMRSAY
jgi:predicted dehydrogenase